MSRARYLLRFDDVCPTMDARVWSRIASMLDARALRPLLAVVPENRDPKLAVDAPDAQFWARVRDWQARGWTIALHGHDHVYTSADAGLLGLNTRSEFAGVAETVQAAKLDAGLAVFARERVRAQAWIAPAHAFDATTLRLLRERGIDVISDGFALWPGWRTDGCFWIPQQLWRFRSMPTGVWTVCLHVNGWGERELVRFEADLDRYASLIDDVASVRARFATRRQGLVDDVFAHGWLAMLRASRVLSDARRRAGRMRSRSSASTRPQDPA